MPYFLSGTASQIFPAFKLGWLIRENKKNQDVIKVDIPRAHLFMNGGERKKFIDIWQAESTEARAYYTQGDMFGANLFLILGLLPFFQENDNPEEYNQQFLRIEFAYFDDEAQLKSFALVYRKDKPEQWMMALATEVTDAPDKKQLYFLKSTDFNPSRPEYLTKPPAKTKANPLIDQANSKRIGYFISQLIDKKGRINLSAERIKFFVNTVNAKRVQRPDYDDCIGNADLVGKIIFSPSGALDVLFKLRSTWYYPSLLKDCLDESSEIAKALIKAKEEQRSVHYMTLLLALHQAGTFEEHKALLQDEHFLACFHSISSADEHLLTCLQDERKLKLLQFLMRSSSSFRSLYDCWLEQENDDFFERCLYISSLSCEDPWVVDALCLLASKCPLSNEEIKALHAYLSSDAKTKLKSVFEDAKSFVDTFASISGTYAERMNLWTQYFAEALAYEKKLIEHNFKAPELVRRYIKFRIEHPDFKALTLLNFCLDERKFGLLSFLLKSKVDPSLYERCLTAEVYGSAVLLLAQLGAKDRIAEFIDDPEHYAALKQIHDLKQEKKQNLCLYFYLQGLAPDEYLQIVDKLQKLPHLADTLLHLRDKKQYSLEELKTVALMSLSYKKEYFLYEYDGELSALNVEDTEDAGLGQEAEDAGMNKRTLNAFKEATFSEKDIEELQQSFQCLKNSNVKDTKLLSRLLDKEGGKLLRILIPLMKTACLQEHDNMQYLVSRLMQYLDGEKTYAELSQEINLCSDVQLKKETRIILHRLQLIKILEDLELGDEVLRFAAQNKPEALRFCRVMMRVEDEWQQLKQRSEGNTEKSDALALVEKSYRCDIYQALFNQATKKETKLAEDIKAAEEKVKGAVNIDRHPDLRKTMCVIANILSIVFTAGIANAVHKRNTGNFLFFSQPKSAEDIHVLGKDIEKMAATAV